MNQEDKERAKEWIKRLVWRSEAQSSKLTFFELDAVRLRGDCIVTLGVMVNSTLVCCFLPCLNPHEHQIHSVATHGGFHGTRWRQQQMMGLERVTLNAGSPHARFTTFLSTPPTYKTPPVSWLVSLLPIHSS